MGTAIPWRITVFTKHIQPEMVAETAALMRTGVGQGVQTNIVINNRAGGNAPIIAQKVAARFLEAHQNGE